VDRAVAFGPILHVEQFMPRNSLKSFLGRSALAAIALCLSSGPAASQGAGDLLVAPTRLELKGFRGTEVVLNNIGSETATYRISLELRRMTEDGQLVEVATPSEAETRALEMITYAPRRVTLAPNQPQMIRVGVRPPADLPDGEYRVHMLFRAIPAPKPATADEAVPPEGFSIRLTPVYGVTIPVFVRAGQLSADARIDGARLLTQDGRQAIAIDLSRTGNRSVYGDIQVLKPGSKDPAVVARGVAIYSEIGRRTLTLGTAEGFAGSLAGPATIQFLERTEEGTGRLLAEANVDLR
jgi:P pilus assembly chaperone PapD